MTTEALRLYRKARRWWSKRAPEWMFVNSLPCKFYSVDLSDKDDLYLEKKFENRTYNRVHGISVMIKRTEYVQEAERYGVSISDQIMASFIRTEIVPKAGDIFIVQDMDEVYHLQDPDNKTFELAYLIRAATPYLEGMFMSCTCERLDVPLENFENLND